MQKQKAEIKIGDEVIAVDFAELGLMLSASSFRLQKMAHEDGVDPIEADIYKELSDLGRSLCKKISVMIANANKE